MSQAQYDQLIRSICGQLDEPSGKALLEEGFLEIDGIAVLVSCSAGHGAMRMQVELGETGEEHQADVHLQMLAGNFLGSGSDMAQLGLLHARIAVATHLIPLAELTECGDALALLEGLVDSDCEAWIGIQALAMLQAQERVQAQETRARDLFGLNGSGGLA